MGQRWRRAVADLLCRAIDGILRFADQEHLRRVWFMEAKLAHTAEQVTSLGAHRHFPHLSIFCALFGIAAHTNFARRKIQILPFDLSCFRNAAAGECEPLNKICAIIRVAAWPFLLSAMNAVNWARVGSSNSFPRTGIRLTASIGSV